MAKLPPIDVQVFWIRDLLNRGQREQALARLEQVLASGKAGAETLALAEYLRTAKRGRQPFGAKNLWFDIGVDNDEMRSKGISHADRMERLALSYRVNDLAKLKTYIAKYEKCMDELRADENNR